MSHPSVRDGLGVIRSATMWSNGLDDVPEVFSHPNESVICHLCLLQCVVLCVCVCAWFLMFPCVPGAWMSSDPYCKSSKSFLSLSCQFTPFWSISLTFPCLLPNCWSFVSVCPLASFCLHFIYTGVCFHACAPVPENVHTCPSSFLLHFFSPACPPVRAVRGEGQAEGEFSFL